MAETAIPVDLRNPGQVFACQGLMEAAETLLGLPATARYAWTGTATDARFHLAVDGPDDPVLEVLRFLVTAAVRIVLPDDADYKDSAWKLPRAAPDDPATCPTRTPTTDIGPALLSDGAGRWLLIDHWADGSDRDALKFWAGAGGMPGAAIVDRVLAPVRGLGNGISEAARDPFAIAAPLSSGLRFDWRRDYVPLEVGFSPNRHGAMVMTGFPFVEVLAAIGLGHARPARLHRLAYRYAVSSDPLPAPLARAVLGACPLGLPMRSFRMALGWPGQEGQARCIIDVQEDPPHD